MAVLLQKLSDQLLPLIEGRNNSEKWGNCTRRYPWYPIPWLMLAEKKDEARMQKVALWFADEQWLHWLLNEQSVENDAWTIQALKEILAEEDMELPMDQVSLPTTTSELELTPEITSLQEASINEFAIPASEIKSETDLIENSTEETITIEAEEIEVEEIKQETPLPVLQKLDFENEPEIVADKSIVQELPVVEDSIEVISSPELPPVIITEPKISPVQILQQDSAETVGASSEPPTQMLEPDLPPIPKIVIPTISEKTDLVFEPFYSVDYFASQGIKLENIQGTSSKVDKQVKSFTEWLKTMKQVNFKQDANKAPDPKVDAQATASLTEKEVITETMAEVLEKQGKFHKAAEIYRKLILLHPEKTTFFAARLQDLKDKL